MLVKQGDNLLVQISAEQLAELIATPDGVIAGWETEEDIPEEAGEVLSVEHGVAMWLGSKADAYASDKDPRRVKETPRVWLDTASARQWVDLAGDGAAEAINAQIVHDADVSAPDCDAVDPGTGFTCTLAANHAGATHVAGLGRGLIAHAFTTGS